MRVRFHEGIGAVSAADWNALLGADNPFLRHEFLQAMEASGSACPATGWTPRHLTLEDGKGRLLGAVPLYAKTHSFGEFVFDWLWADAWHRLGEAYYPKLVTGPPFSPVGGRRLLLAADDPALRARLAEALREAAAGQHCSGVHCLFPEPEELAALQRAGFLRRDDVQFHWHNRGYADFEDYLAGFTARRRKEVRRERRRVIAQGVHFETLTGRALDEATLDVVHDFHALTYARRGRTPYLNREFFSLLQQALPEAPVVFLARQGHRPAGMAYCLRGADTLYGRYWGGRGDIDCLHFEACYYQGIEYCIHEGLQRFEPGTQGEFKIRRGFEPVNVHSAHHFSHARLGAAVAEWLERERRAVAEYREEARDLLPFRAT